MLLVSLYEELPSLGFKNTLIKLLGRTKYVHIQLTYNDIAFMVIQGKEGVITSQRALDRKATSRTGTVLLYKNPLTLDLYSFCRDYQVSTTTSFLWYWLVGRWFQAKPPKSCTDFVCTVLRDCGYPVEERVHPERLMKELNEIIRITGEGQSWQDYPCGTGGEGCLRERLQAYPPAICQAAEGHGQGEGLR